MPEISTYTYNLREAGEILLKSSGITEGKWVIGVSMGINVGNMGQNPKDAKPGIMALVDGVTLTRADDSSDAAGMVIDASKL